MSSINIHRLGVFLKKTCGLKIKHIVKFMEFRVQPVDVFFLSVCLLSLLFFFLFNYLKRDIYKRHRMMQKNENLEFCTENMENSVQLVGGTLSIINDLGKKEG